MARKDFVPTDFDALTPAWLTAALRAGGHLDAAEVRAIRVEPLGEGQGFVGDVARLHLTLDPEEPGAPASVIAKLPTSRGKNRGFAQMNGIYEKEVRFYRELAPEVAVPVPRAYYGHYDETPGAEHGQAVARFLDRLPIWILLPFVSLIAFLSRFNRNRYLLLIEDLAPAEVGDQVRGCSVADCELALRTLARLHAQFWQDPRLVDIWWVLPADLLQHSTQYFYRREWQGFAGRMYTTADLRPWLEWLDRHGEAVLRHLGGPPWTFLHADYRLDNLFFTSDRRVIVADWQNPLRGSPAIDVAYFLSGAFPLGASLSEAEALLDAYHDELQRAGVDDYDRRVLGRDYRLGLTTVLQRLAVSDTELFDLGGGRGQDLLHTWCARVAHLLSETPPEALWQDASRLEAGEAGAEASS